MTLGSVAGIVDDDGGIAFAGAVCGNAGGVCTFHDAHTAGGDGQVAALHKLNGYGDGGQLDTLDDVGRGALALQNLADDVNGLVGDILGAGMGGADQNVACLDGVDDLTGRGQTGVGGGNEGGDHAHGLGVLDNVLLGDLLDDTDALGAEALTKNELYLIALIALGDFISQAGLVHSFIAELTPDLHIHELGGNGLAEAVQAGLIISCNDLGGCACTGNLLFYHFYFFRCNFMCH